MIQQRVYRSNAFNHSWWEFKIGFNDIGNYWIGNEKLSQLTLTNRYKLRIDFQSRMNNKWYYAEYSTFVVRPESENYRLNVSGYSGNSGDSFSYQNGMMFTTNDRDNDPRPGNCAVDSGGGWWHKDCCKWCLNNHISFWLDGNGMHPLPFLQSTSMVLHCK